MKFQSNLSIVALLLVPGAFSDTYSFVQPIYAYRTDVDVPQTQFYKVCMAKDGSSVRLVYDEKFDIRCGNRHFGDHVWIWRTNYNTYLTEGDSTLNRIQEQLNKPKIDKSRPGNLMLHGPERTGQKGIHHVFGNHDLVLFNPRADIRDRMGHLNLVAVMENSGPPDWRDNKPNSWLGNRWKLQGASPEQVTESKYLKQQKRELREVSFNSDTDFGSNFPPARVLESPRDQKVDLILDSVTMADHTPANLEIFSGMEPTIHPERHVIVACPNFKGQERTPEYVLYMQRASSRAKGCFPIQLTRSKNLVYHTLQLFAEEVMVQEKTDPKYRYIPSYGDKSPYKVVVTKVTKDNTYELFVLAKGKKKDALLKGTIEEGRLKIDSESDKHEIYLPQKGREIKKDKTPTPIQNDWQWDVFI